MFFKHLSQVLFVFFFFFFLVIFVGRGFFKDCSPRMLEDSRWTKEGATTCAKTTRSNPLTLRSSRVDLASHLSSYWVQLGPMQIVRRIVPVPGGGPMGSTRSDGSRSPGARVPRAANDCPRPLVV